ncbi:type I pullulanase [Mucilaginibacter robiniae]|uniref:Type I pullulanase n=1 Tax=Mucilaginibacter robiniae TaxID=2728022 RepID=A0A7L5E026_9SPHI|nr:type I pullulanase [Mucilaginibacter robiniae]QJD94884.1 type I pullulanase [Mucilaginibacter robiniae]
MKKISTLLLSGVVFLMAFRYSSDREITANWPVYKGDDLGVSYTPKQTRFKVWAPQATAVKLRLYTAGEGGTPIQTISLTQAENGTWQTVVHQDVKNQYYTFQTEQDGKWLLECPDIYAKAVGINGHRGMVVNMATTNPTGWEHDKKPMLKNFTDIIIYELHVRDLSESPTSGIQHKGKFLGLTEIGTKSSTGEVTGLDHIKQLGVTHIHLLPSFDYSSVDEASNRPQFNWGYDPLNYNVPEGSYATNAYNGAVRIREFKRMVNTLHDNGLRVILDVVYNHTADWQHANFTQFAPGYFYRHNPDGSYSDATGCGNETASEQAMMRKFMVESVVYWAKEYHLDGFRFDLMGVHDIATMNAISEALHKVDPTIFIYGEGWTAGASPLAENLRAVKKNVPELNQIAAFSDDIRDGLRGPFSDVKAKGFVSGAVGSTESVKFGIVASTQHPQINYQQVNYSKAPWAREPYQTISYVSCHDDNTLFDRLKIANPNASEAELIQMDKLANATVLTSQGVTFLQAGAEMLRTKKGIANSYNSPDSINALDWSRKTKYKSVFNYYQGLIALRKHHPAFRMPSTAMIQQHLEFLNMSDPQVIGYQLKDHANNDHWKNILVLLNGNTSAKTVQLPAGKWILAGNENQIQEKGIGQPHEGSLNLPATSAYILFQL